MIIFDHFDMSHEPTLGKYADRAAGTYSPDSIFERTRKMNISIFEHPEILRVYAQILALIMAWWVGKFYFHLNHQNVNPAFSPAVQLSSADSVFAYQLNDFLARVVACLRALCGAPRNVCSCAHPPPRQRTREQCKDGPLAHPRRLS